MVDHVTEIPLPGRRSAAPTATAWHRAAARRRRRVRRRTGKSSRRQRTSIACSMSRTKPRARASIVLAIFGPSGTGKTHLARGLVQSLARTHRGDDVRRVPHRRRLPPRFADAIKIRHRERISPPPPRPPAARHRRPRSPAARRLRPAGTALHARRASKKTAAMIVVTSSTPVERRSQSLAPTSAAASPAASSCVSLRPRKRPASGSFGMCPPHSAGRFPTEAADRLADGVTGTAATCSAPCSNLRRRLPADRQRRPRRRTALWPAAPPAGPPSATSSQAVAKYYRVPQKVLKSSSRRQSTVTARAMAVYLARELAGLSYEQIGHALGGRDHTTIMHNYRKIDARPPARRRHPRSPGRPRSDNLHQPTKPDCGKPVRHDVDRRARDVGNLRIAKSTARKSPQTTDTPTNAR